MRQLLAHASLRRHATQTADREPSRLLGLLCLMYLITYVDRVNIATAASEIQRELTLSNTQLAFVFSAFGYPVHRLSDLRRVGRRSGGAAPDALPLRADLGGGDDAYRALPAASRRCFWCGS